MKLFSIIRNRIKKLLYKDIPQEYQSTPFVISDMRPIDGSSTISFFVNNSEPDVSVTRTFESEDEIVNWLMDNDDFRRMLFDGLFPSSDSVTYRCGVKEPIIIPNKMPGDIDILLWESEIVENSIGIECKVVKSESRKNRPPKINKITSVQEKGTKQANGYVGIGFSKVYLMIILLDDGRYYQNPNVFFRTTPSEYLEELYGFDWNSRLNENIGIIYAHINQLTTNHINQTKGLKLQIKRTAIQQTQNDNLTKKVKNLTTNP